MPVRNFQTLLAQAEAKLDVARGNKLFPSPPGKIVTAELFEALRDGEKKFAYRLEHELSGKPGDVHRHLAQFAAALLIYAPNTVRLLREPCPDHASQRGLIYTFRLVVA